MADPTPSLSPEAYERVRTGVLATVRRGRRRRDFLLGSAAGIGVTILVGGAAVLVTAPQEVRERQVWCYGQTDLSGAPEVGQRALDDPVADAARYAVDFCAAMWRAGIVAGDPGAAPTAGAQADAPALELCVRTDGTFAVVPRGEADDDRDNAAFCASRHLDPDPRDLG